MKKLKKYLLLLPLYILSFTSYTQNFTVNTATYIGGSATDDIITGVDVAPDGTLVASGKLNGYNPGGAIPVDLLGGGDGVVLRLNNDASTVLSITRIGDTIHDIEVGPDGEIAVCGTFGVGVLEADASAFKWVDQSVKIGSWSAYTGTFFGDYSSSSINGRYRKALSRVSIGSDGTVATMQHPLKYYDESYNIRPTPYCWVYIYNSNGSKLAEFTTDDKYNKDICVDGNNQTVIHAGWNPKHAPYGGNPEHPIHVPFMRAYDYSGTLLWENYDWSAADCYDQNHFADSRVNEVVIGDDGYLYMAGYIHGGDHLWRLGPKDITNRPGVHIGYDNYSNATLMGAGIDHAYFCKYNPVNGDILAGQAAIVRKNEAGTDKPNQSQIKGIDADANGKVYLAGYCQLYIKDRSAQQINGQAIGSVATSSPSPSNGSEPFLMVVSSDWQSRDVWTVFSENQCEGTFWGLGLNNGLFVAAGQIFYGEALTFNALQSTKNTGYDGYLISWGSMPISVNEVVNNDDFKIFPVPAQDKIHIINNKACPATASLIDIYGKIIETIKINNTYKTSVPVTNIQPGVYFIHINCEEKGSVIKKIEIL